MAVTRKTVLSSLTLNRLKVIAREMGLDGLSRSNKSELISIMASTRRITTEELLAYMRKNELSSACVKAGLNNPSRTKAGLVTQLLDSRENRKQDKPTQNKAPQSLKVSDKNKNKSTRHDTNIHHKPCPKCGTLKHPLNACHECGYSWYKNRTLKNKKNTRSLINTKTSIRKTSIASTNTPLTESESLNSASKDTAKIFRKGDRVKHPSKDEWGIGEVLENCRANNVRIFFVNVGEKTLSLDYVSPTKITGNMAHSSILDSIKETKAATGSRKYRSLSGKNYFTHYWSNKTWFNEISLCKEDKRYCVLDHSASNLFRKRGVSPGDYVYIVTNISGKMYLGGRIEVETILNRKQAAVYLSMFEFELWEAKDHIVMPNDAAESFTTDNIIPTTTVKSLRFGSGLEPLFF